MNIHYYLIINEQASSGNGRKVARKVIQQLKQQELKYTALYTDYAGHEKIDEGTCRNNFTSLV